MPYSLAIASGKGGVGKTTISVNLALTQSKYDKCLLLDADMGMANAHILLGINPKVTVREVINGESSLKNAIVKGPNNLKFLSGGSGITELLSLDKNKKYNFIRNFDTLAETINHLIIDVSAGADEIALNMVSASDRVLIVLVNEPTSFMDAFTLIKACSLELNFKEFCLVANMVSSEEEGKKIFKKFNDIVTQFYDVNIKYVGSILMMNEIKNSILNKKPVILDKNNTGIISIFERILRNINSTETNKVNGIKFFNSA